MATIQVFTGSGPPNVASLSAGQTGDGASTNIADRGRAYGPALLRVATTVGATPTCTYNIEGSPDAANWFNVAYSDSGTPESVSVAAFTVITATTVWKILRPNHPWRFLRVSYSTNVNVTNTADVWTF